jgi:nicotinate-nucleotide pyrophosphorylase (carboxylating)
MFSAAEKRSCRRLIELALEEDLGRQGFPSEAQGDPTSEGLIAVEARGQGRLVARQAGVLAGLPAVEMTLLAVDASLSFQPALADGACLGPGTVLARLAGPLQSLLRVERTALNFLQRLCGIASLTRRFVDAVAGLGCRILDTRKTTPGWRLLEKYAVRCGGGHNHRLGLYDAILIKDNHLRALGGGLEAIRQAIDRARRHSPGLPVEIEVDDLDQLGVALACRPDIVLLDNMDLAQLRQAVALRNAAAAGVQLEASGGVTLDTVRAIAETGVERISVGALTHSAPALDIALDLD